ncbi:MAG: SteA domain-containing protein, partial [Gaiellaceae bacterium]
DRLGLPSAVLPSPGISEDVAILLAHEKGAELIVAVGTHFNLLEFLERNRAGMSSTFFTRLKVGDKLVDARGVSSLFRGRAGLGPMLLFALGGLGAIVAAVAASSDLQRSIELLAQRLQSIFGL